MKRIALLMIVLCVGAGLGWGQAGEKKPEAAKPIAPLSWLVGGTWTADASKMGPGMKQIETRYRWSDNGAYIQFNTHFVFDKGTAKAYDGNFFWNPDQKSLAMWYMDAKKRDHAGGGGSEWRYYENYVSWTRFRREHCRPAGDGDAEDEG